jgi:glutamyl-tRNA reductase
VHLLTLGLNHTTAPLAVRERISFAGDALPKAILNLQGQLAPHASETAILSTCNRTEVYCVTKQPELAQAQIAGWLDRASEPSRPSQREAIAPYLYALPDDASVRHAFRVACGLESMVLGEPQILGQMKQAARVAHEAGSMGTMLHQLFQRSFTVAKQVRSSTEIGAHSTSLAATAVKLAKRVFGPLETSRILFIGAGEMIELAATHFAAQTPERIVVANRTVERANRLAASLGGQAIALTELPERFAEFDVIVSCTASSLPIIGLGQVERALKARRNKPILIFDLAVPRDVEPEISKLRNVFLYSVDDLGRHVDLSLQSRRAAVESAELIIESQVKEFLQWISTRSAVPQIQALHARAQRLKESEIARALKMLDSGRDPAQVLHALANSMTSKYLHGPIRLLNQPHHNAHNINELIDQLIPEHR